MKLKDSRNPSDQDQCDARLSVNYSSCLCSAILGATCNQQCVFSKGKPLPQVLYSDSPLLLHESHLLWLFI